MGKQNFITEGFVDPDMEALEEREALTVCNKCQQPVSDPLVGNDGELYHRNCGESLAMFE